MAVDIRPQVQLLDGGRVRLDDVVETLRARLGDLPEESLRRLVAAALDELGEVRVTTYLPILVERKVRAGLAREQQGTPLRLPA